MARQTSKEREWAYKFEAEKPYHEKGFSNSARIKVTAGLHHLQGNERPYFSITAEVFYPGRRDSEMGGQMHDDVLKYWPELAPVVKMHFSDDSGMPMHAEQDGWYWLAGFYGGVGEHYHGANGGNAKTPEECLVILSQHLRMSLEDTRSLAQGLQSGIPYREVKPLFLEWCKGERKRWALEAQGAIETLDRLIAEGSK